MYGTIDTQMPFFGSCRIYYRFIFTEVTGREAFLILKYDPFMAAEERLCSANWLVVVSESVVAIKAV